MEKVFLKAEWRKLLMANYVVDPDILKSYLPAHTELDLWEGKCYVSLVGFMFIETEVMGFRIPFHIDFEEINLRFYVRRKDESGKWRRGVVFIKEIVPKAAITLVANTLYKENYATHPTKHLWKYSSDTFEVEYAWKAKRWHRILATATPKTEKIKDSSEEEFITEHYWGYAKRSPSKTIEYEVEHPLWEVYPINNHYIDVDFGMLYGSPFASLNNVEPQSVLLAEGSEIIVRRGKIISQPE